MKANIFLKGVKSGNFFLLSVVFIQIVCFGIAQEDKSEWQCPEAYAGQELNIFNWTSYIAANTVSDFERLCDVTVTYTTFPTDDEMIARIRQGNPGYDIVVPTQKNAELMIAEGLLLPIDFTNIPNFAANVLETLKNPAYDSENLYTVPYQWGTMGIGYDVTKVEQPIESWQDLFDYDGPVVWLDDKQGMLGIAFMLLGYDVSTDDVDEITEARDFLIDRSKNVIYIGQDDGQEWLVRGEADVVIEYNGDIFQIMDECECDTYKYVLPEEGTLYWVDVLAIPVDAPNKALAEVFIDYVLDAHIGASISNYVSYASPNAAAIEQGLIDEAMLSNINIYPDKETLQRLFTTVSTLKTEQLYNDAWDEVRILVGQ